MVRSVLLGLYAGLVALAPLIAEDGGEEYLPRPPYPFEAWKFHDSGTVVLAVTFGQDGKVVGCKIIRTSGSQWLDEPTVEFVKANWRSKLYAGTSKQFPFHFKIVSDAEAAKWRASFPTPSYPAKAYQNHEEGIVIVEVTFGPDGKVTNCHVVRSTSPLLLDFDTVSFIQKHWNSKAFAGRTAMVPITYLLPGLANDLKKPFLPVPLNMLSPGDPERKMSLRLKFDDHGWVDRIDLVQSSGSTELDRQTEIWVKVHWHSDDDAGKVLVVPFDFKPPPPKTTAGSTPSQA